MSSTEHELDILQLLLEGLTNREMANELHLSPFTLRNIISNLFIKYEARNRTELIIKYLIKRQHDHKCVFPKTNRIR